MNSPSRSSAIGIVAVFVLAGIIFVGRYDVVRADEFTSTSFRVLDPVISPAGYGTSTSYQLWGTMSQIAVGTSTATNFSASGGFLYFPFVSTPVASATAGDAQVALSWTAAEGALGWTVSGYNVGQAIVSGGPYTYSSSLGNVLSSTHTGLTNGTTYYFIIRPEDAFGNTIATSSEVSVVPVASAAAAETAAVAGGGGILESLLKAFGVALPPRFPPRSYVLATDLNDDGKVDLRDLSVFLYFMSHHGPSVADFNDDKRVDLRDFSVLLTGWTDSFFALSADGASHFAGTPRVSTPEEPRRFARAGESLYEHINTQFAATRQGQSFGALSVADRIGEAAQSWRPMQEIIRILSSFVDKVRDYVFSALSRVGRSMPYAWISSHINIKR